MIKQRIEKGFTLIELVVVMVILAIMTAVAIPQYFDLRSQARIASLNGLVAAINGASELTHSKYLAMGTQPSAVPLTTASGSATVDVINTAVANEGYPKSTVGGIDNAVSNLTASYKFTGGPAVGIYKFDPPVSNCEVHYNGSAVKVPASDAFEPPICPEIPIGAAVVCNGKTVSGDAC